MLGGVRTRPHLQSGFFNTRHGGEATNNSNMTTNAHPSRDESVCTMTSGSCPASGDQQSSAIVS